MCLADMPASAKASGLPQHNAKISCRFCYLVGCNKPGQSHYYLPTTSPMPDRLQLTSPADLVYSLPMRNHTEHMTNVRLLETARDVPSFKRDVGISHYSCLLELNSMIIPFSFPVDVMHLFLLSNARNFFDRWRTRLSMTEVKQIDDWINHVSTYLPYSFGRRLRSIQKSSSWTSEEWLNWTLFYSLPMTQQQLSPQEISIWTCFVKATQLVLQHSISTSELSELEMLLICYVQKFESLYYQQDLSRIDACRPTLHQCLHVAVCIRAFGPPLLRW